MSIDWGPIIKHAITAALASGVMGGVVHTKAVTPANEKAAAFSQSAADYAGMWKSVVETSQESNRACNVALHSCYAECAQ